MGRGSGKSRSLGRRAFTAGALAALTAAPFAARAQQGKTYRIALASSLLSAAEMAESGISYYRTFFRELRRLGYVEGRNLIVERWPGSGIAESEFPERARKIVETRPDLIVSNGSQRILEFKALTRTIPIMMLTAADPVAFGIVERLSRPGGNITGFAADAGLEEVGKRLQFAAECAPTARTVAFIVTPSAWRDTASAAELRRLAEQLGLSVTPLFVDGLITADMVRAAIASVPEPQRTILVPSNYGSILVHRTAIVEAALALRMPLIGANTGDAEAGMLFSYSAAREQIYVRAAGYVDRILKGTPPGELPVQLPTTFDFVLNLTTAKALGLTIPMHILVFATELVD